MDSIYDEDFILPQLSRFDFRFPDPRSAPKEGLLAHGGDLSPTRLLEAYRQGIFPWYAAGDPILWWSPDPRLILYPEKFKVRKSFRKVLRNRGFEVRFDTDFESVIHACATVPRRGQKGSWILPEVEEAYTVLHHQGYAHSVEVYLDEALVGGLYGVAVGAVFCGESMFSKVKDASKVAFKALSDVLASRGYDFIDCQLPTDHMIGLGAETISRDRFLTLLQKATRKETQIGSWRHFRWEYSDG